jgi:hypothetical protein
MHYGVTGTRKLNRMEVEQVKYELWELDRNETHWHIGDADGVDKTARDWVTGQQIHYNSEGWEAWQLAARSTKMVKALAVNRGTLHAWANKLAPEGLKPNRCWKCASGSGTWGTVALAVGLGVPVELHWLGQERVKPDWLP